MYAAAALGYNQAVIHLHKNEIDALVKEISEREDSLGEASAVLLEWLRELQSSFEESANK